MSRARNATKRLSSAASQPPARPHRQPRPADDNSAVRLMLPGSAYPSAHPSGVPHPRAALPTSPASAPTPLATDEQASQLTHLLDRSDRRAHPDQATLKERAFALSCLGHRSPTIAAQLGVPERTIRRWLNATLLTLAQDAADPDRDPADPIDPTTLDRDDLAERAPNTLADPDPSHARHAAAATTPDPDGEHSDAPDVPGPLDRLRALAIERQLSIALTARAAYDRLMARHDLLLGHLSDALLANLAATANTDAADTADTAATPAQLPPAATPAQLPPAATLLTRLIPQLAASATRQLHLAQIAHREAARLQGVTAYAQTDAHLAATAEHAPQEAQDAGDQQEGGFVPIRFFDAKVALDAICSPGPDDAADTDETLPPATKSATSPATSAATKSATSPATPVDARPLPSKGRG